MENNSRRTQDWATPTSAAMAVRWWWLWWVWQCSKWGGGWLIWRWMCVAGDGPQGCSHWLLNTCCLKPTAGAGLDVKVPQHAAHGDSGAA